MPGSLPGASGNMVNKQTTKTKVNQGTHTPVNEKNQKKGQRILDICRFCIYELSDLLKCICNPKTSIHGTFSHLWVWVEWQPI